MGGKLVKAFSLTIAIITVTCSTVFGATVYRNGPNYVTNTEKYQLKYEAEMFLDTEYRYGAGYTATGGYIRYIGHYDTGRVYTSGGRYQTAKLTFNDTWNPIASKSQFYYSISERYVGGNIARAAAKGTSLEFSDSLNRTISGSEVLESAY